MEVAQAIGVRVTLLHQPGAGDDEGPDGPRLESLIRAGGHSVRYQSCSEDRWHAALDEPADVIAVAGGDGTVGRVAKKLIGRDIPVAPLPMGTANNIAKTLDLDALTLEEIIAAWRNPRLVTFDAGVAKGPWGVRYFVEGAGMGAFASTIPAADRSQTLKSLASAEAKVAYARKMLHDRLESCAPHRLDLRLDGDRLPGDYVLLEAMNMEFIGPNLYLAPDTDPSDGRLDVVLVTVHDRDTLRESMAKCEEGELEYPTLTRRAVSTLTLEWDDFELHFDDEVWPDKGDEKERAHSRIEFTAERGALKFLTVPA